MGDIGPGGGLVFYVSATPFSCGPNHADDCKYLEAAPKTWSGGSIDPSLYWNLNYEVVDGISRDASPNMGADQIGLGLKNSNLMAAADTSTSNAAVAVRAYRGGSKSDWYVPTISELGMLCRYAYGQAAAVNSTCDYNLTLNTGIPSQYEFSGASYQSSSQSNNKDNAQWHQNFVSGGSDTNSAQQSTWGYSPNPYPTRPIRAFGVVTTVADGNINCGDAGTFTIAGNIVTSSSGDCSGAVTIPYGVTSIGYTAFWQRAITSISIPNTVRTIADSALRQTAMTSVTIPGSVESIGYLAFATTYLTQANFATASNLTTIGDYAFQSSRFTTVTIPASVTTVGVGAFELNTDLTSLIFSGTIPSGSPWDAPAAVYISGKVLCGTRGYFAIQANAVIGRYNCRGSVVIPVGVTAIGSEAFDASTGYGGGVGRVGGGNLNDSTISTQITSLTIPNTVTAIGSFAFRDSRLTSLTIPNSVTSIDIYAFAFSTQIASLTLGNGLTSIGNAAFADLGLITSLTIPDGVSTIGGDAFIGTTALTTLNYCGNVNLTGTGLPNPATNASTCTPAPPLSLSATSGNVSASIAFTAGATFSETITNYEYSLGGGSFTAISPADATSPVSISGLTNGTTYSLRLRAVSARGAGAASAPVTFSPNLPSISVAAIGGVTVPVTGATPVTSVTAANGYTGTVSWSGSPLTFAATTIYTATITLTADAGYRLSGVSANFFTVAGATSVTHSADSGVITVDFPATDVDPPAFTISSSAETVTVGTAITGYSINSTGGTIASYTISPAISSTPGLSFDTSTGLISGTPTATASSRTYTITAINPTIPNATRTFTITVTAIPPSAAITTTTFTPRITSNLGVSLSDFDQTQSYQVTVKFVNNVTNTDVINGTLFANQGSTTLVAGYKSYAATKLGFKGTYAAISTALTSLKWNPESVTAGISLRIGIASIPGAGEYYDANSGHYYKFVSSRLSWNDARTASEATILYGQRGYLAEVNTAAENAFIGTETTALNVWIGASDQAVEGTWIWDGATSTYNKPTGSGSSSRGTNGSFASWANGEPNDHPWYSKVIREDCAVTNWSGQVGKWNDWPCPIAEAYLIEFGGRPGEVSTAATATLTSTLTVVPPVQYTITYNPNNGNSTPTQPTRTTGQTFNLASAITRSPSGPISYLFAGWVSNGKSYAAGETFTVASANLDFTAAWAELYEVTYISNGGTFSGAETDKDSQCASDICSLNQSITLNLDPTRNEYLFNGWIDQSGELVSDTNPGMAGIQTTVTANRYVFTASWTPVTYTVSYISSGSTAPTQDPLMTGELFTVANAVSKAGHRFDGWSDGAFIYLPGSDLIIQASSITLTAQWTAQFTVTYAGGLGSGTPPSDSSQFITNNILVLADATGLSRSGFDFNGWSDGALVYQSGAGFTVGTSNMTFTAQWVIAAAPASSAKTSQTVVKLVSPPKISRDASEFTCSAGSSLLIQDGNIEAGTKLAPRKYLLIQDGKVVDSVESANPLVKFEYKNSYLNSIMSCSIQVGDSDYLSTITTLSEKLIADAAQIKKSEIAQADKNYSSNRSVIYAERDRDLARVSEVKAKEIDSAKTAEAISLANSKYRKTFAEIAKIWNSELQKVKEVRDLARATADTKYRSTLEKAGVSIVPQVAKSAVTPKPTPTPTPSPSTSANTQVTPKMEIVGTVYMASGSYFLNDATKRTLNAIAKKIRASSAKNILVYGHADSQGGVDNTALSRNRAKAVAAYIRPLLGTQKISIGWFSSKKPAAAGTTAADLALNRRVEIYTD